MKKFITLLLFLFPALLSLAQKPLTNSRTNSPYTLLYRLDDESTLLFLTGRQKDFKDEVLKEPVFKFINGSKVSMHLPPGNYLQVSAEKNELHYELIQKHSATFKQLINSRDISFILLDTARLEIKDAQIYVRGKQVPYDALTQSYHFKQTKKDTLIKAAYKGVNNFYIVGKQVYPRYGYRSDDVKKVGFWAKVFKPIGSLFKKQPDERNNGRRYWERVASTPGFIILNKPKYKEGDTVKFKAFILKKGSKLPIGDRRLMIRLAQEWRDTGKVIGYVNAYRKGGFESQFVLSDSLDLDLDDHYTLSLEPLSNLKLKYKEGEDKDRPNPRAISYAIGEFKYEDYELKSNKFTIRTDGHEQSPGVPVPFYFKAVDENGLNVPDGRVNIVVQTPRVGELLNEYEFVRDTLAIYTIPLDPVGETKFTLPDSIFPKAKIDFNVKINLLNSNNEDHDDYKYLSWDYRNKKLELKAEKDSMTINYMVSGKSVSAKALLSELAFSFDTLKTIPINLPAKIALNQAAGAYAVKVDSVKKMLILKDLQGDVDPTGYRTADSLFLRVDNPRKLKFWYTVFADNSVIAQGSGTEFNYRKPHSITGSVSILVNYVWGGQSQYREERIPYQDRVLNIDVKEPATIYPGQQAEIEASVTDNKGKPVVGADITAYGLTAKFENYYGPALPYLGKYYAPRKLKPQVIEKSLSSNSGLLKLNWKHWAKGLDLDTVKYYQFTHPETVFKTSEQTPDKVTQVAPFVVKDGEVQPVHIIYIDGVPVFFSQSQEMAQYSFAVDTGMHVIRMRTANYEVKVPGVRVSYGKKLILSINGDSLQNKAVYFTPMPDSLTIHESELMNRYMIAVIPNFTFRAATLQQKDRIHLINYTKDYYYNYNAPNAKLLVGPFANTLIDFGIQDGFSRSFFGEGGYSFEFSPGLTKQKSIATKYPFSTQIKTLAGISDYKQYALSSRGVDTLWQNYLDNRARNSFYPNDYRRGNARLLIKTDSLIKSQNPLLKCVLIFKNNDADYLEILSGTRQPELYNCEPGEYKVLYLFKGNTYYVQQHVVVKGGGSNYYQPGKIKSHAADSMSMRIGQIINDQILGASIKACNEAIRETFNIRYLNVSTFKNEMSGRVLDKRNNKALAGITVTVAGVGNKILTDANGKFKLKVPQKGKLRVSSDAFLMEKVNIQTDSIVTIYLKSNASLLTEATIRGYVRRSREQTTGASTIITAREVQDKPEMLLQGKVAGLNIQNNTGAPGQRGSVNIRGLSEVVVTGAGRDALYVVDGVVMNHNPLTEIKQEDIASMDILSDAAATALYGARGANGVVVIMTVKARDKQQTLLAAGGGLRHRFSDYAYWQPKLTTDANGKVKFNVTYPDDITGWRTFMVGVTDNRRTGFTEGLVKSFKPVSANFTGPLFAVKGDSFSPIGKLLNYTADAVGVQRKFSYNGKVVSDESLTVKNSRIDTFKLIAEGKDSLHFEYSLKRADGYFDGERRSIPVFEPGSLETKGSFSVLEKDTTISLKFDPNLKEVTLRAEASALPVLLNETELLRNYEYLCNEQLASKLKGLLAEKTIREYLKQPFKWDEDIKDLIKKLTENRRSDFSWGWWKDTPTELWISLHVIEALSAAEAKGFKIPISKNQLIDYLLLQTPSFKAHDKLLSIKLLQMRKSGANLKAMIAEYEQQLPAKEKQSDADKYQLMLTRQLAGMPIEIDTLLKGMHRTMFGNVYWGEQGYNFFYNSIPLSLTAYHILKNEGKHPELLMKLRNYFMEQRGGGNWRNTYESSQILETILPDMLVGGGQPKPAAITLSGDKTETISKFPYETKLDASAKITVKKTGDLPVYLTTYQKFWNPAPAKVSNDFTVDTWFNKGRNKIVKVKGGEAITLTAEITARADADFVMVEIPIPAGCSYNGKEQGYGYGEVHREYFTNKVSIFCRRLTAGKHTFTVKLMPRYGGNYHVNPAKAEMMYFPVFYGREGMKMLEIE